MSEREDLQNRLAKFLNDREMNQPYGVLDGMETTANGQKVRTLTFCRPRTLDGTVHIYSPSFFTVRSNRVYDTQVFRSIEEVEAYLGTL